MSIEILDNMQFNLINNKSDLIKEFDNLCLTVLYSNDLEEEEL